MMVGSKREGWLLWLSKVDGVDEFTKYDLFEFADMERIIERLELSRNRCLQIDEKIHEKMKPEGLLEAKLGNLMGVNDNKNLRSGWVEAVDFPESSIS